MKELEFGKGFKYPFNRPIGLWNGLWILLPIFGWLALLGYQVRLVREWVSGKFKQTPKFSFVSDMKLGFFMFLKLIPLILAIAVLSWVLSLLGSLGDFIYALIAILVVPILVVNLFVKNDLSASFEFEIVKGVFDNIGDYILMFVKEIGLQMIFVIMSIVLVGIPAALFTHSIFISDFYRRNIK